MSRAMSFKVSGEASPKDGARMLDEVSEHFVEHARVERTPDAVTMTNELGVTAIRLSGQRLLIELSAPTQDALHLSRNDLAEHLFYFAGDEPLGLIWQEAPVVKRLPNLREITVIGVEDVTPRMRRVRFRCDDITPFVGGGMHVRLLVPPAGRQPVWPGYQPDGRIAWPKGEDELLVRIYTVRGVDVERRELWIDFLQHPAPGVATPGADFALNARPGDRAALLGPGGGGLPASASILLVGDESALPAIARIAAEASAGTRLEAIVEVEDVEEEQPLVSDGQLDIRWLHRKHYAPGKSGTLAAVAEEAIHRADPATYLWVACEKDDVLSIRSLLKDKGHDRKKTYVAWYWERSTAQPA